MRHGQTPKVEAESQVASADGGGEVSEEEAHIVTKSMHSRFISYQYNKAMVSSIRALILIPPRGRLVGVRVRSLWGSFSQMPRTVDRTVTEGRQ